MARKSPAVGDILSLTEKIEDLRQQIPKRKAKSPSQRVEFAALLFQRALLLDTTDEAISDYLEAIRQDPFQPLFHFHLGRTLQRRRCFLEAERAYKEALDLQPNNARFRIHLGALHLEQGEMGREQAEKVFGAVLQTSPENEAALVGMVDCALLNKGEAIAKTFLSKIDKLPKEERLFALVFERCAKAYLLFPKPEFLERLAKWVRDAWKDAAGGHPLFAGILSFFDLARLSLEDLAAEMEKAEFPFPPGLLNLLIHSKISVGAKAKAKQDRDFSEEDHILETGLEVFRKAAHCLKNGFAESQYLFALGQRIKKAILVEENRRLASNLLLEAYEFDPCNPNLLQNMALFYGSEDRSRAARSRRELFEAWGCYERILERENPFREKMIAFLEIPLRHAFRIPNFGWRDLRQALDHYECCRTARALLVRDVHSCLGCEPSKASAKEIRRKHEEKRRALSRLRERLHSEMSFYRCLFDPARFDFEDACVSGDERYRARMFERKEAYDLWEFLQNLSKKAQGLRETDIEIFQEFQNSLAALPTDGYEAYFLEVDSRENVAALQGKIRDWKDPNLCRNMKLDALLREMLQAMERQDISRICSLADRLLEESPPGPSDFKAQAYVGKSVCASLQGDPANARAFVKKARENARSPRLQSDIDEISRKISGR